MGGSRAWGWPSPGPALRWVTLSAYVPQCFIEQDRTADSQRDDDGGHDPERRAPKADTQRYDHRDQHDDGLKADVVSTESLLNYLYVEGETDTYEFRLAFEHLAQEALDPEESRELIVRSARQLWELPVWELPAGHRFIRTTIAGMG
jgi:Domain of unknown function (DUF5753)